MIGKRRVEDFRNFSDETVAKETTCKTYIFAGLEEGEDIYRRATETQEWIKDSKLFLIEKAKHDLGQKECLRIVEQVLSMT